MTALAPQIQTSGIGSLSAAEWKDFVDPETGRNGTMLTNALGNSYPLYYFIPTITSDGRYLVFHSERSSWVQLYRMDLETGEIGQLTNGNTRSSGWAFWCEPNLRGIYNHLSALNTISNEVYYFQDNEIWRTHVPTFSNSRVAPLPRGRMPMGQSSFSPDGKYFAFIHVDRKKFQEVRADSQALKNMKLWKAKIDGRPWLESVGDCTLGLLDTQTGAYKEVITTDFHFHHALFLNNNTLLVNHPKRANGMWTVDLNGKNYKHLRPQDAPGAHNASICHQTLTDSGIFYEANAMKDGKKSVYSGRYNVGSDTFEEVLLPATITPGHAKSEPSLPTSEDAKSKGEGPIPNALGYTHTGNDPAGRFLFIEQQGDRRALYSVHHPRTPERLKLNLLRTLSLKGVGQRNHAHPFLSPDRQWMYFTDLGENGFNQVHRIDVRDLVDLDEYW